ncbi:hypothetical protein CYLTODRAFT_348076 [Cylindrobasidium torrendii FP15055 ss-10]|uniref:Phosphatidate phosphatase APP1 catalytic domain-containing protein n=1 Tax=Cylindrobasidium torrendii FP15055 ss-10 TaxID=1314674 RepID=A0A0D7BJ67_9AGAR|nr:hypothetical protein CYLTODRAFT_348076 [Cylindrobasidium torrendii FP15055 ss-10]
MRASRISVVFLSLALSALSAPSPRRRAVDNGVEVLLFDSPAFQNPADASSTLASIEVYTYQTPIDTSELGDVLHDILSPLSIFGVDASGALETALDRVRLVAAVGKGGQAVTIDVNGCSQPATLGATSTSPDNGLAVQTVSLGQCGDAATFTGALTGASAQASMTVFPSADSGFGVISDIDDTVKVSHVLNKLKLAKATLFDEPEAVAGMPELYSSLASSLSSPNFIYITGSPYQLYPFLRDFIDTSYSETPGPIFAKNLTLSDLGDLSSFLFDSNSTFDFKTSQIARVHEMYPNKKFLTVGDSTEKDPETYGEAFRTFGADFIQCIWIRAVDKADNSDKRFAAAFKDVPKNKYRVYSDDDIVNLLPTIDVAGGAC